MIKWITFFLLMSLFPGFVQGQPREINLRDIVLTNMEGDRVKLVLPKGKSAVFIILGVDCPISQKYIPAIGELSREYADKVDWIAVFPKYFSVDEVLTFKNDYNLKVDSYIDQDMELIGLLSASVTPEVFLVDTQSRVQYAGAIDDWFYELGRYRAKITRQYLKGAIDSLASGNEIKMTSTVAIGCPIEKSKSEKTVHMHHK